MKLLDVKAPSAGRRGRAAPRGRGGRPRGSDRRSTPGRDRREPGILQRPAVAGQAFGGGRDRGVSDTIPIRRWPSETRCSTARRAPARLSTVTESARTPGCCDRGGRAEDGGDRWRGGGSAAGPGRAPARRPGGSAGPRSPAARAGCSSELARSTVWPSPSSASARPRAAAAKKGFSMSPTTSPTVRVVRETSARATPLGVYPSARALRHPLDRGRAGVSVPAERARRGGLGHARGPGDVPDGDCHGAV